MRMGPDIETRCLSDELRPHVVGEAPCAHGAHTSPWKCPPHSEAADLGGLGIVDEGLAHASGVLASTLVCAAGIDPSRPAS